MSVDVEATAPALLKALVEPLRWRIIELLAGEELCVCHLVEALEVPQPLVSHHLKVLRDAGVVISERQGTNIVYSLSPEFSHRWSAIGASLAGLVQVA